MSLINTDGLVLIGPGSEWFWTALSGFALVVTFLAIYRQLRLQASQSAIEQVERISQEWGSERLARSGLAIAVALEAGADPAGLPGSTVGTIANFWDKVGYLVRSGYVDRRLVHGMFSAQIQQWWTVVSPRVQVWRQRIPAAYSEFEWLVGEMARLDSKAGLTPGTDPEYLAQGRPRIITELREVIQAEEELKTVRVRIVSTPVEVRSVRANPDAGPGPIAPGAIAPSAA